MLTEYEETEMMIERLEKEVYSLKEKHEWGDWENWYEFTNLHVAINELKIKLLKLENESLRESLQSYQKYKK